MKNNDYLFPGINCQWFSKNWIMGLTSDIFTNTLTGWQTFSLRHVIASWNWSGILHKANCLISVRKTFIVCMLGSTFLGGLNNNNLLTEKRKKADYFTSYPSITFILLFWTFKLFSLHSDLNPTLHGFKQHQMSTDAIGKIGQDRQDGT